jgi:RimJ/RimL family protein N-acetyltransferase
MASTSHPLAPIWPPARIRITTPRLELRMPTDDDVVRLMDAAVHGIHEPTQMPFAMPWTDAPPDELRRSGVAHHARCRADLTSRAWTLLFAVYVDGEPVGAQDVMAKRFDPRREVETGSWLARRLHGAGLGTEMREAVLHFAFDSLGALAANSGAYEDNTASNRVSEKVGYVRNGRAAVARSRGERAPDGPSEERAIEVLYRIDRARWLERRRDDIQVVGVDQELRDLLGAAVSVAD